MKRIWSILLMMLILAPACTSEQPRAERRGQVVYNSIHYAVSVSSATMSKASLNGDTQYIFEAGDRLFMQHVEAGDTLMYGFLSLISGAGSTTAYFEGDLACADEFEPESTTSVNVTLVSASDRIHSYGGGKLLSTSYPEGEFATTLAEAVQKYSDFTCAGTFGSRSFALVQNSTFLVFKLKLQASELDGGTDVDVSIVNGSDPIWEGAVTSVASGGASKVDFIVAFPGDEISLSGAKASLAWSDAMSANGSHDFDNITDAALAANNYYTVSRSTLSFDGFRIRAKENGTTMTFKYTDGSVEFSEDLGGSWTTYDGRSFSLDAGEEVCFQGTRADCDCIGATQLFTANKVCYIAGDITSLLADRTQFAANAFRSAFSNGTCVDAVTTPAAVTCVDIDPDDPLILPAFTSQECYREMFRNCTSLTTAPDLPAETAASGCYWNMFRLCTGLTSASINLGATTLAADCCREMFRQCSNLTSAPIFRAETLAARSYQQLFSDCTSLLSVVCLATDRSASGCTTNWMSGVTNNNTRTFYKAPSMSSWPSGNNGIPSNWVVEDYSE